MTTLRSGFVGQELSMYFNRQILPSPNRNKVLKPLYEIDPAHLAEGMGKTSRCYKSQYLKHSQHSLKQ